MTLEELKALMEAALVASQAAPSDKALQAKHAEAKKAYDDAVAAAEEEGEPGGEGDPDETKFDDKTKAYIAKLRKEAAGARTKNKDLASKLKDSETKKKAILAAAGISEESETPEEKIKVLSAESQQLAFRTAILESAVQNGIGKDDLEFYEYLVTKAVSELKAEDDEVSDEAMAAIVAKVKKAGASAANTSVGGGAGGRGAPNPSTKPGEITLEKFITMNMSEKSKLYQDNPDLYTALVTQAKKQKKLV